MKNLSNWVLIAVLLVIGCSVLAFAGHGLVGYWFWKHLEFFIMVWLTLPVVAFKLRIKQVRSQFSIFALRVTRNVLFAAAALISVSLIFHYGKIRDTIGHQYIDGYYTTTYIDVTDAGQQIMRSDPHTAHWYSRVGLWLFEWVFMAACICIPVLTWIGSNMALDEATIDCNENTNN